MCTYIFFSTHPCCTFHSWVFPFFSWQMSPLMRRFPDPKLRKRRMLTLCAVGFKWGIPCSSRGGGMGASVGSEFILFSPSFFLCGFLLLFTFLPLYFFHLSGAGSTEKGWFPMGGGPQIGDGGTALGGWGIGEDGSMLVAGSEAEGFYGLLRGAMSHSSISPAPPPHKKVCHTPSATLPSAPSGVHRTWCPWSCRPGNEGCLSSCSLQLQRRPFLLDMQPLHIQLGGIKWVYWCQVEGCKEGPSTSHATICAHMYARCTWGGVGVPLLQQIFFQPRHFLAPQESHFNQ